MSVAQISPYYIPNLINAATEAILCLPYEDRAGWVIYLMEKLDAGTAERDGQVLATELLRDVLSGISERLELGGW